MKKVMAEGHVNCYLAELRFMVKLGQTLHDSLEYIHERQLEEEVFRGGTRLFVKPTHKFNVFMQIFFKGLTEDDGLNGPGGICFQEGLVEEHFTLDSKLRKEVVEDTG